MGIMQAASRTFGALRVDGGRIQGTGVETRPLHSASWAWSWCLFF